MNLFAAMPEDWRNELRDECSLPYFNRLQKFIAEERRSETVFPPEPEVFSAFAMVPYEKVRVLIVGQDPYHDEGQAHGLCFSVRQGVMLPPSLKNIYKELEADLGIPCSSCGCLEAWARQGVLLLNTVLTVRAHHANSHRGQGWEDFTDAVIRKVNGLGHSVIFVLWGGPAQRKLAMIDTARHCVVSAAHPSPLSAYRGFFGSRPFSKINAALQSFGYSPIDWRLTAQQPDLFSAMSVN